MEESRESTTWRGSAWDIGSQMDPYGIREVVLEFDNGDSDTFRARRRAEFYSYEISQMAHYLETVAATVRTG